MVIEDSAAEDGGAPVLAVLLHLRSERIPESWEEVEASGDATVLDLVRRVTRRYPKHLECEVADMLDEVVEGLFPLTGDRRAISDLLKRACDA